MARPVRTDGSINVTLTWTRSIDMPAPKSSVGSQRRYRSVRLGSVDEEGSFIPNHQYIHADEAFRSRLVFPPGWNLEKAESMIHLLPRGHIPALW
jgi:hypothetical protein